MLAGKRDALAAVLSTVDGVTGNAYRPAAPNVGDAWPVLGPGERAAGSAFLVTWAIRVFVPQDERAASAWWDTHWPPLYWALEPVAFVSRFAPIAISAAGGDQLLFEITIQAEE